MAETATSAGAAPPVLAARARNARIDSLRGVAILCVMLLHYVLAFGYRQSPLAALLSPEQLRAVLLNGNFGVTMFFVISGYLITSNSLVRWPDPGTIDTRRFYVLRAARIMPPLLAALAVIVVLGTAGVSHFANTDGGHNLPASYFLIAGLSVLTFWHNVLMQSAGYFNYCLNVYWSLSVEEVYYLAFPLVLKFLPRTTLLVATCASLIIAGPLYRARHADDEIYFMYGYLACFDAIAFGCLAALYARHARLGPCQSMLVRIVAATLIAVVYLRGIDGHEVYGFTWLAAATALYLVGCARAGAPARLGLYLTAPLRWLGQHSYECYLFHVMVLAMLRNLYGAARPAGLSWLALCLCFLALSALVAYFVAHQLAEPCNRALRRRYGNAAPAR